MQAVGQLAEWNRRARVRSKSQQILKYLNYIDMFSAHSGIKLQINYRKIIFKSPCTRNLRNKLSHVKKLQWKLEIF